MWALTLFSVYVMLCYLVLVLLWLILGAIINPTNFLPFATAASTFIVIVISRYKTFKQIAEIGY